MEAYLREPDITNPDDLFKILTVCNNAGGLSPNKAKAIAYDALGETAENFEGEWGDIPLAVMREQNTAALGMGAGAARMTQAASSGQGNKNTPPASNTAQNGEQSAAGEGENPGGTLDEQLAAQIEKAAAAKQDEVVAVMKEVRRLLVRIDEKGAE